MKYIAHANVINHSFKTIALINSLHLEALLLKTFHWKALHLKVFHKITPIVVMETESLASITERHMAWQKRAK